MLLKNPIKEEHIWAQGPQIIAEGPNVVEYLLVYDGGKAFGKSHDMFGFNYYAEIDEIGPTKLGIIANIDFNDQITIYKNNLNIDYEAKKDLAFFSFEEALTNVEATIQQVGVTDFKVNETYSLDLETMKSHYETYLQVYTTGDEQNLEWTESDEAYLFSFQQTIDNIPVINTSWQMPDGTKTSAWGNPMPQTNIRVIYDLSGIRDIYVGSLLTVKDELDKHQLISLYEALEKLIESYSLTILEEDVSIISAELCYLRIPKKDREELIPGWVFRSTTSTVYEGDNIYRYKTDVVNAVTGELYLNRW